MPLVRIDLIKGRTDEQIATLLDATHRAIVSAFKVPWADRYHIVSEHAHSHLVAEDTGLGIERTKGVVIFSITSRPRSDESKLKFYEELCRELKEHSGIEPSDVIVNIVTNSDADWSFGHGRAQFKTGELRA